MAQTITNQASLGFQYNGQNGSALSNIASVTVTEPLAAFKKSVEDMYHAGEQLTFTVSLVNSAPTALTDIAVADNLGSYTIGSATVTPLTFVPEALLYIDGVYNGTIVPSVGNNSITFSIDSLAAGSNAILVYEAQVNSYAPLAPSSEITNTVTVTAAGLNTPVTAENEVTVDDYADVSITKSMSPATVVDGSLLTYNFTVYNYGNTAATEIVLTDTFDPAPTAITVTVNGSTVAPANYTYTGGVLTLPTGTTFTMSLPAATITGNPTTGLVTVVPSSMAITVTGTI